MDKFRRGDFVGVLATGKIVEIRTEGDKPAYIVQFGEQINRFGLFNEDQLCEVEDDTTVD